LCDAAALAGAPAIANPLPCERISSPGLYPIFCVSDTFLRLASQIGDRILLRLYKQDLKSRVATTRPMCRDDTGVVLSIARDGDIQRPDEVLPARPAKKYEKNV